ncbi:MAG: hypothetical protein MHM6MM_002116 [Cercozoa sp. M6MM]
MPGVLSKLVTIKTEIEFIETYCSDKASLLPDDLYALLTREDALHENTAEVADQVDPDYESQNMAPGTPSETSEPPAKRPRRAAASKAKTELLRQSQGALLMSALQRNFRYNETGSRDRHYQSAVMRIRRSNATK